ncbi:MAG TPA: MauE/DoxX family redox-associated membrane protein [Myxococcales bacterium]|nr:MauE/DoxX family redox-associated membrane protein [Myxococcales bacterium]
MTRWGVIGCRVVLGALFLWAAATKVPDMNAFAQELANYRLLPAVLVPWAASAVVGVEIVAGLALVTGFAVRAAAVVIAGLLLAFIAFLSQALLRGIDLRCGCFGGDELASWWTVARDLAMLAAALLVAWRPEVRQSAARQAAARAAR